MIVWQIVLALCIFKLIEGCSELLVKFYKIWRKKDDDATYPL
jgi:hypothetical protein